ncbi:hypothetical protein LOK49_LG07G01421 [Camellia lanceoleosa]|uniref:Uncharacterized protein n=1 Tax=Camellia lanceoleosa TaxID=1840588 RepID=A0ACC0H684_9ERIC|nr:hypothetical protein LOK49_LG07G01421 [Camellia lanceoleosa]
MLCVVWLSEKGIWLPRLDGWAFQDVIAIPPSTIQDPIDNPSKPPKLLKKSRGEQSTVIILSGIIKRVPTC